MDEGTRSEGKRGLFSFLSRPSRRYAAGTLLGVGMVVGFLLVAGGALGMGYTNTTEFCISCHSMRDTVYIEFQDSIHYKNASGMKIGCPDCHVPKAFGPLMVAKVLAVADVYHEVMGTVDTKEKFDARRWMMANKVWKRLEDTDSGTCRSCHDYGTMDLEEQDKLSRRKHKRAAEEGTTCIECHRGLTHDLPDEPEPEKSSAQVPHSARSGAG